MEPYNDYLSPEQLLKLRKLPQSLPQIRGIKEDAPDGSEEQKTRIDGMVAKHYEVLKEERIVRNGNISKGIWNVEHSYVEITSNKGSYWNHFGRGIQNTLTLNAEESLFLIEQGCLEVYYGGMPLSVQQAMSILLPKTYSLNHYMVYSHLCRLGYVVIRHQNRSNNDVSMSEQNSIKSSAMESKSTEQDKEFGKNDGDQNNDNVVNDDDVLKQCPASHLWSADKNCRPLVRPRDAKSTSSVLSKLQVIKTHRMDTSVMPSLRSSYSIDFDVYLPGNHFTKSHPGVPDFCISVCRFSDPPPSLAVINNLTLQCQPTPLKFALVADGTITINSLIDVQIPVYVSKG